MTALDPQIVHERLAKLEEVIIKLEREKPQSPQELATNELLSDAILYRLQVGIEAIVDIGNHILAEEFNTRPETYRDTLVGLGKTKVVPAEFIAQNLPMTGFRNLIVHHYATVDLEKVYAYVEQAPDIFRQFAQHFSSFLQKR